MKIEIEVSAEDAKVIADQETAMRPEPTHLQYTSVRYRVFGAVKEAVVREVARRNLLPYPCPDCADSKVKGHIPCDHCGGVGTKSGYACQWCLNTPSHGHCVTCRGSGTVDV